MENRGVEGVELLLFWRVLSSSTSCSAGNQLLSLDTTLLTRNRSDCEGYGSCGDSVSRRESGKWERECILHTPHSILHTPTYPLTRAAPKACTEPSQSQLSHHGSQLVFLLIRPFRHPLPFSMRYDICFPSSPQEARTCNTH